MRSIPLPVPVLFGSIALLLSTVPCAWSEEKPAASTSPLSTHVLNTTTGKPASGVSLVLQKQSGHGWDELRNVKTDAKGRVSHGNRI